MNSNLFKREENASRHINVLTHYDDDTLIDKSGKLIKIIKLSGLNYFTKDQQTLDIFKARRNNLLKSISSEFALYFWQVRRKTFSYPAGEFNDSFAKTINDKYKERIQKESMFHTEHYLALITKQAEGLLNKGQSIFSQLLYRFDKIAKQEYLASRHKELNEAAQKVLSAFADYDAELLTTYEKNGIAFSAPLEFISQIINFNSSNVPLKIEDAAKILPRKRLFFNNRSGTIEMRAADGSRKFAAILAIKAYAPVTRQGMLDKFNSFPIEYTITQSFRFYDTQAAKSRMRDQQQDMLQSKHESITQTEEIDAVLDDTASGEVGYGRHHFTLTCYADSQDELNKDIATLVTAFSDIDITCVREDVACELDYWAQLPGNFPYICRSADISSKNMAALASFHNEPLGRLKGNHWGDAVTVFETLSGSPYYFNFHHRDVGNFLVFGGMGSGKSVLVAFLIAQSMKFGGKRVIFDKDRGLELFVRAMRGTYERIKPGIKTGFNPCRLNDTAENRQFLLTLFSKMLKPADRQLTTAEIEIIEQVVHGIYQLDQADRQLCHFAPYFGAKKAGSLRAQFDQWHSDGTHAWLFDNEIDSLNLDADVIGFDLASILDAGMCKTPALMYLTYRIEQALAGVRGMLFCDEGWLLLDDDYFKKIINDWSRTPRKKNNIFGLATQVANDTVNLAFSKSINESAFCKIFFPNPAADRRIHMEEHGLSEHEWSLLKTLPDDKHYFLLKSGNGINAQSLVLRANLTGLETEIALFSGREETLALFDQVRLEVGNDVDNWLLPFQRRLEEKKDA